MITLLLLLHILLFVFAFGLTAGLGILTDKLAAGGDAALIHTVFRASRPLSMAGGFLWLLSGAMGGALAAAMGYDMTAPWLLASYGVFAGLMIVGFGMHAPWQAKVIAAAPGPDLIAVLNAPAHKIANLLSALGVLTLLYLMIARPG